MTSNDSINGLHGFFKGLHRAFNDYFKINDYALSLEKFQTFIATVEGGLDEKAICSLVALSKVMGFEITAHKEALSKARELRDAAKARDEFAKKRKTIGEIRINQLKEEIVAIEMHIKTTKTDTDNTVSSVMDTAKKDRTEALYLEESTSILTNVLYCVQSQK